MLVASAACSSDEEDSRPAYCDEGAVVEIEPTLFLEGLGLAEDLAFDGMGSFVAMGPDGLVRVDGGGETRPFPTSEEVDLTAGMRFSSNGNLVVTRFLDDRVDQVSPDGTVMPWIRGIDGPNAIASIPDGTVWISASEADGILRVAPGRSPEWVARDGLVVSPNGLAYDTQRRALFFAAGLGEGELTLGRIDVARDGSTADPVEVVRLGDAAGDGIALDACGDLWVIDNARVDGSDAPRKLRRFDLDEQGEVVGPSEVVAEFPVNTTNLEFGRGPGFEATSLYTIGFAGVVYRVDVGREGAPVGLPEGSGAMVDPIDL